MVENWKKEIARDILALGSIPFYILVIVRAIIGKYAPFVYQLIISWIVLIVLVLIFKNSNKYIARCFILIFFTSLFYHDMLYTVFASLIWVLTLISLVYLKVKRNEIIKGILFGIIAVIAGYYLTLFLVVG